MASLHVIARRLATVVLAATAAGLIGCASNGPVMPVAELGAPPAGYETWDDYWEAKDAEYREFERDSRVHQMKQPRVPGSPW